MLRLCEERVKEVSEAKRCQWSPKEGKESGKENENFQDVRVRGEIRDKGQNDKRG